MRSSRRECVLILVRRLQCKTTVQHEYVFDILIKRSKIPPLAKALLLVNMV
jgi:hypothetical protein